MFSDILYKDILIGQIYDLSIADKSCFPTSGDFPFQFGFGVSRQDKELVPHIHKRVERVIYTTSEFLYVISGEMKIDVYSEDEIYVQTVILKDNQALLQHVGGHRIALKQGTRYFELKQGPYFGRDFDKYDIEINNE